MFCFRGASGRLIELHRIGVPGRGLAAGGTDSRRLTAVASHGASGTASGSHGAGPWHVALPVAVTVPGLVVPGPVPVSGWRVGPAAGPVAGSASDRPGPAPALRTVSLVPLCCQCLNLNLAMADLEPEACRWDQGHRHETRAERRPPGPRDQAT